MRACFVVHGDAWSGEARAFADGAALLAARGYETCFVAAANSEPGRRLRDAGQDVIDVATDGGWLRAGWRLRRVIQSKLTEVIFVHSEREHLVAAAAARLAGRGAVVRRIPSGQRLTLGRDGRLAMRMAATGFVFAHADDLRGVAPPRGALAAHVAPPGVAVPATLRPGHAPAAVGAIQPLGDRLVIIAGADRRREALVALRTLALLAPRLPALRATIFAPAHDADALRLQAAALGVAARLDCRSAGEPRTDALATAALLWVIASDDEAAFALLDALAYGVPALAERTPLSARFIEDGLTGVLHHRGDEADLASAIAALLARADTVAAMRVAARHAAQRWPFDGGADGWLSAAEAARDRTRWHA